MVTPTGEIIRTGGKTVKNVTGYDLTRLIVGSEECSLGIVTEAIIRLIPKPQSKHTFVAHFNHLIDSGHAITSILSSGILPSAMELMDNACIRAVESYRPSGLPLQAEAILIIEIDGHPLAIEEEINKCADICRAEGASYVKIAEQRKNAKRFGVRVNRFPRPLHKWVLQKFLKTQLLRAVKYRR